MSCHMTVLLCMMSFCSLCSYFSVPFDVNHVTTHSHNNITFISFTTPRISVLEMASVCQEVLYIVISLAASLFGHKCIGNMN